MIENKALWDLCIRINDRRWSILWFVHIDKWQRIKYFEICTSRWMIEDKVSCDLDKWMDHGGQNALSTECFKI